MRTDEDPARQREFPTNWDVIRDDPDENDAPPDEGAPDPVVGGAPPKINLLASSWADAVAALAVCTAALLGLNATGHQGSLAALPWASILGVAWWLVAAAALVTIRQGTPGMLLAGVHFSERVAPRRVAAVVVTAAVCALLVGLPGLLGARRSPLAVAGGSALESVPLE